MSRVAAVVLLTLTASCTPVGALTMALDAIGQAKAAHDRQEMMDQAQRDLAAAQKARTDAERRGREKTAKMIAANEAKRAEEIAQVQREREARQAAAIASQPGEEIKEPSPPALPAEISPTKSATVTRAKFDAEIAKAEAKCKQKTIASPDRRCIDVFIQEDVRGWVNENPSALGDFLKLFDDSTLPDRLLNLRSRTIPKIRVPESCRKPKPEVLACWVVPIFHEIDAYIHGQPSSLEAHVEHLHELADKFEAENAIRAEKEAAQNIDRLSNDEALRIVRGPKIGERFTAGSWGFEIESYNLEYTDDEAGYILTIDFIAENRSRREQMVSSRFVYLLDKSRIKYDSERIADLMIGAMSGQAMIEEIPPGVRARRRATFQVPLAPIDGDFSIVFQDPLSPTKRVEIKIDRL